MPSTELVPAQSYAAVQMSPEQLLETIKANVGSQKLTEFDLDRVRIPAGGGKAWEVPSLEGTEVTSDLQGVVVFWKDTRAYWKVPFDKGGGGTPPDCSSPDAQYAQGDPGVPVPKAENGLLICDACPNAQFGSDPREDSNAQACRLVRQLFLLTPEDLLPIVVSLPPTSVGESKRYFLRLSRRGVPYYSVVSKIGLEQAQSNNNIKYSHATFSMAERLEGEQLSRITAYAEQMRPAFESIAVAAAAAEAAATTGVPEGQAA